MLSEKYKVRRNTRNIWWDLSVPLTILGYEDNRRSVFKWVFLCVRATFYLIIGPRSPHKIVLNLDASDEGTTNFWAGFIKPNYLVIVNQKEEDILINKLVNNTVKNGGKIVYDEKSIRADIKKRNGFSFGKSKDAKLKITLGKSYVSYRHGSKTTKVSLTIIPKFSIQLFASVLGLAVLEKVDLNDASYAATKVDFHSQIVPKVIKNL